MNADQARWSTVRRSGAQAPVEDEPDGGSDRKPSPTARPTFAPIHAPIKGIGRKASQRSRGALTGSAQLGLRVTRPR